MPDQPSVLDESMSRRRVLTIGGGAVLASLGLSVGGIEWARRTAAARAAGAAPPAAVASTATPTATRNPEDDQPWPPPPIGVSPDVPTVFSFDVASGVPADEEQLMRQSAIFARDYFHRRTGAYLSNRPRIHLNMSRTQGPLGEAGGGDITLLIGNRVWPRLERVDKIAVVCHEVFHLYQFALAKGASSPILWLIEGAAEYASQMAVIESGMRTKLDFERSKLREVVASPQPPLVIAGRDPNATEYALGALAADQLAGDRGVPVFADYYRRLADMAPLAAFEAAFGETRGAFEARFEAWRVQRGIPARA